MPGRTVAVLTEAADFNGQPLPGRTFDDAIPIIGNQYNTLEFRKNVDGPGVGTGDPAVL